MIDYRGSRNGVLIVGDSLPPNAKTLQEVASVLDPKHSVYNSLILPIKFYLNNYLNSYGYQLPIEKVGEDYFYYINAVNDPRTRSKPDLTKLKIELDKPEHKIILSMGSFAFWAVEKVFNKNTKVKNTIVQMGSLFKERIFYSEAKYPINLPILHNIANLRFEKAIEFIPLDERKNYISYFHYIGVQLGGALLRYQNQFQFIKNFQNIITSAK